MKRFQAILEVVQRAQAEFHPTNPTHEDIATIIDAAYNLVDSLYAGTTTDETFKLRKALEGIFGHDPDFGEEQT